MFARGEPPEASYAFKHALVRDAAHESLLKSRRRELHARIVRVLEERFPETADAEPELLARHFAEAGLAERAAQHWLRAAELAIGRSANLEAIAHCEQAEAQLRALPSVARTRAGSSSRSSSPRPLRSEPARATPHPKPSAPSRGRASSATSWETGSA